jgi:hypothetical protein
LLRCEWVWLAVDGKGDIRKRAERLAGDFPHASGVAVLCTLDILVDSTGSSGV